MQATETAKQAALENHIAVISELADHAAEANLYGLQDVCLLITEALNERLNANQLDLSAELEQQLQNFPALVVGYLQKSLGAAENIIQVLSYPELNIPLAEEEYAMIVQVLANDIELASGNNVEVPSDAAAIQEPESVVAVNALADEAQTPRYYVAIEQSANQAAEKEQYGVQDVCLLVLDALQGLLQESLSPSSDLLAQLEMLPMFAADYAIEDLLAVLTHPELRIPITHDELSILTTLLQEGRRGSNNGVADLIVNDAVVDGDFDGQFASDAMALVDQDIEFKAPDFKDLTIAGTPVTLELVGLLVMEAESIALLLSDMTLDKQLPQRLDRLSDELVRYASASKIAGFLGLAHICEHVHSNVQYFYSNVADVTVAQLQVLQEWIQQVQTYLHHFMEDDVGLTLIGQLTDANWPVVLEPELALVILEQIRTIHLSTDSLQGVKRPLFATEEDVSLVLPDDVNQELLSILLQELPVYTQEFSESIVNLQSFARTEDLDIAQRIAHTLKGSANTVGIVGIATLTHHLEDILEACAKANKLPGKALIRVLSDAADCLADMTDALMLSSEPPIQARSVLQEVLDWANQIDQGGLPDSESEAPVASAQSFIDGFDDGEEVSLTASVNTSTEEPVQARQTTAIRVQSEQIDTLLRLSGESLILNSQANERLRRIKTQLLAMDAQFKTLQRLSDELEQLIDIQDLSGQALRSSKQDFDSLEMDQYNELYTTSRRLVEAAFDAQEMNRDARHELEQMNEVLEYQQRLVIDSYETVLQTRLVPIASIVSRLQRTLRQTCRLTGKLCELTVSGQQHLIDGEVLNSIIDPLMHVLRNAIDHGIENEAQRIAAGKPAMGQIHLEFDREGNNILIRCRDDGKGLDFAAIRQVAEARGVIQPGQVVSEEDLKRFILQPNFSTRTESTQVSGRGVGMNAVYYQVQALGGSLTMRSRQGLGLVVELKMPLPISRSHALLVAAGSYRVAITSKGLNQILYVSNQDFVIVDDQLMLRLEDKLYPATSLNKLLHIAENPKKNVRNSAVLLAESEEQIWVVSLDNVIDSLDIVIKDFGYYIKKIPGYIGAAILGDGAVAPVLDIPELLRLATQVNYVVTDTVEMLEPTALLPKVLVVDDSLSQRRSLEQLLSDAGFAVYIARDGIEAVELLADVMPDIMLTDLEMPRMNGIELTAHVRSKRQSKDLPIIMITSRTTQKHRKMAEDAGVNFYIAKPVREDDLLSKIHDLLEGAMLPIE